jgi:predicted nucleic acid-binding protein
MGYLCVDANIVVKWLVPEEEKNNALALLYECNSLGMGLVAPDCMYAEVGASLRRKVYRGVVDEDDGFRALTAIECLGIDMVPVPDLVLDAWYLAAQYNLPTLYDAYYLALARAYGCDLWTVDRRFLNSLSNVSYVRDLRDYSPGSLEAG